MKNTVIFIIIGITLVGCNISKTSYYPKTREISIFIDSFKVKTNIFIEPYTKSLNNSLKYYWFYSDKFGENFGGYNGYLLHGEYKKVSNSEKLVEQGAFKYGLKDGEWKFWNPDGSLKRIEKWNNGKLSSKVEDFSKEFESEKLQIQNDQTLTDTLSVKKPWYKRIFKPKE